MKKTYTKPEINFDSFSVSSYFAASVGSCNYQADASIEAGCGVVIAGRLLFTSEITGCKYISNDGEYGACYYVPTGDSNVFIS